MRIQSSRITSSANPACSKQHDHEHAHPRVKGQLYVTEALVDTSHAALELYGHSGGNDTFVGGASALVSGLAAARGIQNLRLGGLEHSVEGVGNLALSAASGMVAFESFTEHHEHGSHAHSHGFGLVSALECVHGLAEVAVGTMDIQKTDRRLIGMLRMAKGAAVVGSQLIPNAAVGLQVVHLGAACVLAALDPKH